MYPIRRVGVESFFIPQDNVSFVRKSLFTEKIHRRIFFGLVDNTAYNGTGLCVEHIVACQKLFQGSKVLYMNVCFKNVCFISVVL